MKLSKNQSIQMIDDKELFVKENTTDIEKTLIDVETMFREEPIHADLYSIGVETNGIGKMVWESDQDFETSFEDEEYYDEDDDEYYFAKEDNSIEIN